MGDRDYRRLRLVLEPDLGEGYLTSDLPCPMVNESEAGHLADMLTAAEQLVAAVEAITPEDVDAGVGVAYTAAQAYRAAADWVNCLTCTEPGSGEKDECPQGRRPCGHHCNCSWTQDACCWCGLQFLGDGETAPGPTMDELLEQAHQDRWDASETIALAEADEADRG